MLSQQPHYDFGMRAVKSVLIMAGQMKRLDPTAPEDEILIKAMNGANVPKLLESDYPLYKDLVQDLFPGISLNSPRHEDVAHILRKVLGEGDLQHSHDLQEKSVQLRQTMLVRFGVALVGEAASGKSTLINSLANCLLALHNDNVGVYENGLGPQPVHLSVINPKVLSVGELYGNFNPSTDEWSDGIAAHLIREATRPSSEYTYHNQWINFDGPIDPLWVENLNTVLDDNKMLCLASGERIKLPEVMRLLFEVNDLNAASPATVSRLGVVYVPPSITKIESIYESWCTKNMTARSGFSEIEHARLVENFTRLAQPCAEFLRSRCTELIPTSDIGCVTGQCKILEAFFAKFGNIFDHKMARRLSGRGGYQMELFMSDELKVREEEEGGGMGGR